MKSIRLVPLAYVVVVFAAGCLTAIMSLKLHDSASCDMPWFFPAVIGSFASSISMMSWSFWSCFISRFKSVMNCFRGSGCSSPWIRATAHCCAYAVLWPAWSMEFCVTLYAVMIAMGRGARIFNPLHRPWLVVSCI